MGMKSRFCVKCGKNAKNIEAGICPDCYYESEPIKAPKKILLRKCKNCAAVEWKGIWLETDAEPDYYFEHSIIEKLNLPKDAALVKVSLLNRSTVELKLNVRGKDFVQKFHIQQLVREITCQACAKRALKLWLAKIQLRGDKDWLEFFNKPLVKYQNKIVKVDEQRNGIDIYFATKEAAKHFTSDARNKIKLKVTETKEVHSWDKSKNRPHTRNIILLRLV